MEARLRVHKRDWEDLGDLDPVWAILSRDAGKHGGCDLDDFFATGEEEIARMLDHAGRLGYPAKNDSALDFGCGIGRLSRALATRFDEVLGIDIFERMVEQARELNGSFTNCRFIVVDEGPQALPDERFDLIYTRIVLQHLPSRELIADYVVALIGRLKPGGLLVFQLPSHIPARKMIQPRRRAYSLLRALGVKSDFLYRKLGLNPNPYALHAEVAGRVGDRRCGRPAPRGEERFRIVARTAARESYVLCDNWTPAIVGPSVDA